MRVLALVLVGLWSSGAIAAPIRIDFAGSLTSVSNTNIALVGDRFHGFAQIDETGSGTYEYHLQGIDVFGHGFHRNNSRPEFSALLSLSGVGPQIGRFDSEEFLTWFTAPIGSFDQPPFDLDLITGGFFTARWRDNPSSDQFVLLGTMDFVQVPEPGTLLLLGAGMLAVVGLRRRRPQY